jgi:ADP-ribose pyrophosphatase YjhB (NUDIX family)
MATDFPPPPDPRFCPICGSSLSKKLLPTEERPRLVCDICGHVAYMNPKVVVNVVVERRGRILMMRRAIEPRYGTWSLPGGFMEIDETLEECAMREAREETGVTVNLDGLVGIYSRPAPKGPGIVSVVFRGTIAGGAAAAGAGGAGDPLV